MDSGKKTINHVEIRKILPVQDGYRMPGEYEPHRGCILIWPERPGSWRNGAREAKKAFADVIRAIAKSEEVYLAASGKTFSEAEKLAQHLQTASRDQEEILTETFDLDELAAKRLEWGLFRDRRPKCYGKITE